VDGCPIRIENGVPYPADFYDGPASLVVLGTVPAAKDLRDYGGTPEALREMVREVFGSTNPQAFELASSNRGHATMSIYTNNGTVFSAGTTDWTNGLKGKDPAVEQITRNLLNRLTI
jgi:hypothetical protein